MLSPKLMKFCSLSLKLLLKAKNLHLDVLGRLSPLKTQIRELPKENPDDEDENDGYSTPGSAKKKENYIPKERIFQNISSILDEFDLQKSLERRQ